MAMMAKMRSLAPWFIILVGGVFVLFMVISDSNILEFMGQQSQYVGSVDGDDITYQEFTNLVDLARQNQEQATGQQIDESQMDFFRDQVWDLMVSQKLLEKKIEEFGIIVTDEEIRNALLGPNPPAFLMQQFTDSAGVFNRMAYEQALRDPQNKQIVVALEEDARQRLIQEKLQNYVSASVSVSDSEVKERFIAQNIKMRADFIQINPNTIPDSEINFNDNDLKNYYQQNLDKYKIEPARKIKYVLFNRVPSTSDTLSVLRNLEAIVAKMKTDTASFKTYVEIYSESPYSRDTLSMTAIPADAKAEFENASTGDILGPINNFGNAEVYKIFGKVKSKNEVVRASHILIKSSGSDNDDLKKANDVYDQLLKGADFAELAKQISDDPGSGSQGGDLGWFGKGQMVKEFEEASFKGPIGIVQKPVKSVFGYHIIKVTGKSSEDFIVEKIVNRIQVSATTIDRLYQDAQDFAYIADDKGFELEAQGLNYDVVETPPFSEDAQAIPGLGVSRPIVKWAFNNKVGAVSDIFKVNTGYTVVTVSEIIKAGFKDFEDVKALVQTEVVREKKFEKAISIATDIRAKLGDNGNKQLANEIYPQARVDSTAEFTTFGTVSSIGREYAFVDYSYSADLNKWSNPFKGNLGVYLINVRYRTKFLQETFDMQKLAIRRELLQQKKNTYYNNWVQELKKNAKITDNRHLFFRY